MDTGRKRIVFPHGEDFDNNDMYGGRMTALCAARGRSSGRPGHITADVWRGWATGCADPRADSVGIIDEISEAMTLM